MQQRSHSYSTEIRKHFQKLNWFESSLVILSVDYSERINRSFVILVVLQAPQHPELMCVFFNDARTLTLVCESMPASQK